MKRKSFDPAQIPASIPLDSVRVATPCHADWDKMQGDDSARFCPSCAKNVYNLSAMTSAQAQQLLQEKEGHLCIRFFQREDGTMLTQDCPVGVAALKERSPSFALWAGVASLVLLAGALVSPSFLSNAQAQPDPNSGQVPAQTATPEPQSAPAMMGDFAFAPSATVAPTPNQPKAAPTSKPAPQPLMGKPMMPHAKPTPQHEVKGEMAPVPTAKPQTPARPVMMGRIARPTPVPSPAHKPSTSPKKAKASKSKRR